MTEALTWDALADLYDKEHTGRPARTLPMDYVFDWAERQTDRFYVDLKESTIHLKENNMNEETAIVPVENVQLGTLHVAPEAIIERASKIAKALTKVIEDRHLYVQIGKKQHVYVEGWNTLGSMIGISSKEREVKRTVEGEIVEYEAYVDLIRNDDGLVIGGASAICRTDEKNWSDRPLFAVRSMAITRATGKAFRLKLSWIMELAGFSPTPAEEMDFVEGETREVGERKKNQWEQPILEKLKELGFAKKHVVATLEQSPFKSVPYGELEIVEAVAYMIGRQRLKEQFPKLESQERADLMNKAWEEKNVDDLIDKAIELLNINEGKK